MAWLIPADGQGEISIVDLGEAQPIEAAVQQARTALEKGETTIRKEGEVDAEKQLRAAMRNLTQVVFQPLEEHFGQARQLILSPDAALWLVPWGALPLPDGKYAIQKYQIRYCISGRNLVNQATNSGQKATAPVLFANPDYDMGPAEADAATRAVLRNAAPVEQVASSRGLGTSTACTAWNGFPGRQTKQQPSSPA